MNEEKDIPRRFLKTLRNNLPIEIEGMIGNKGMKRRLCGKKGRRSTRVVEYLFLFRLVDRFY
jgi:hypothetical protein